ncbi:hypothetical protein O5628_24865 [Escherichia coli]|nr:hypothetical protein [Escherichia coli]
MGFIAIESNAVRKIVSERMLQSADYEKGQILADVLKEQKKGDFSIDVKVVTTASGIYLLTKEPDKKECLFLTHLISMVLKETAMRSLPFFKNHVG